MAALGRLGATAVVEEIEGAFPSPTVLIDGAGIDGYPLGADSACRVGLPAAAEIERAILAARARREHCARPAESPAVSSGGRRGAVTTGAACGGRALCGWAPPSLPADSALKRRVDRIRLGNLAAAGIVVAVVALLSIAAHMSVRPASHSTGWQARRPAGGARSTSGAAATPIA